MIIDAVNKIDVSINVGRTEGMKQLRRTGITPWKKVVSVYDNGGKAKGLGIMFIGDYVENDEITFEDVKLQLHTKEGWKVEKIQITIRIWIAV